MNQEEIRSTLAGEKGDDAQFEMMKFMIRLQVERAFGIFKVTTANNIQKRDTLHGPSINYNERGNSNYKRRKHQG